MGEVDEVTARIFDSLNRVEESRRADPDGSAFDLRGKVTPSRRLLARLDCHHRLTTGLLLVDVFVIGRRPHEPSMREVRGTWSSSSGWRSLFGIGIWVFSGAQYGGEFFAGWLTEYSLSVDNLFIFIIIMSKFAVPRQYQQTALLVGIVLALVMRGIFIALGAAAINAVQLGLLHLRRFPRLHGVQAAPRTTTATRTTTRRTG